MPKLKLTTNPIVLGLGLGYGTLVVVHYTAIRFYDWIRLLFRNVLPFPNDVFPGLTPVVCFVANIRVTKLCQGEPHGHMSVGKSRSHRSQSESGAR